MTDKRHTIVVLLQNEFGALSRVANLFSARGYNIESLNVATTLDRTLSRMTITSIGSESILSQIIKQLNKLIDVVDARVSQPEASIIVEYILLRLNKSPHTQAVIDQLNARQDARVDLLEDNQKQWLIGISLDSESLEKLLTELDHSEVEALARSGALAINRCRSN